jgi:hypothetical protein
VTATSPGPASGIAISSATCVAAAVCVAGVAAIATALAGSGDDTRALLAFDFSGVRHSPSEVVAIAVHNGRFAAGTLTCAVLAPRVPRRVRLGMTALLTALLVSNAGAVGIAIGAYGTRVLRPHMALELGALSLAGGAYVQAARRPLSVTGVLVVAASSALLLRAAATLETYASFGGATR